jgi:serine/threonine protein kinase
MSKITSSSGITKNDRLYINQNNISMNKTIDRLDFIRLLLEDTELLPMFDMEHIVDSDYCKDKNDVTEIFDKKLVNFDFIMCKLGNFLMYIKSGTTGHTFKGMSIPDPSRPDMELNYAVKVVAYPKEEYYGGINDVSRPENAELLMLRILSYFVVKRHTPHIVLPITTFNTKIHKFISLGKSGHVVSKKYKKFIDKYKNKEFYDDVSVLISEWANGGDLLDYLRDKFSKLTVRQWRVIFFQIISTVAVIQSRYPGFRHNDLKLNNILIQVLDSSETSDRPFQYTVDDQTFYVPNIGLRCKIWDFDFACIPGIVENSKVNALWTNRINVKSEAHQYYDVHYFFNTMISEGFIGRFFDRDDEGNPLVPDEVTEFVKRIVPTKIRTGAYVSDKGRLLISYEQLTKVRGLFYKTPLEILTLDPFFSKMRLPKDDK